MFLETDGLCGTRMDKGPPQSPWGMLLETLSLADALLFSATCEGRADIKSLMGASKSSSEACRPLAFVTGSWRDFKHSHPTSWRFCFWLGPDITTRTSFLTVFQHISCWSWKKTGRTFEIKRTSSLCRTTKALFWK